jgi:nucleotide-binding universal stress UspA family protein
MSTRRPVLHATDFSAASGPAFEAALARARDADSPLVLVHVLPPLSLLLGDYKRPAAARRAIDAAQRRDAGEALEALAARARARGVRVSTTVLRGVAWEQITRTADRMGADVIILGTHGRGGFSRFLMGSVAERVIAMSRRPVMTVHGVRPARRAA